MRNSPPTVGPSDDALGENAGCARPARGSRLRRGCYRLLLALGIWWGLGLGIAWLTIAPIQIRSTVTPAAYGAKDYTDVALQSADGTDLAGWLMPANGAAKGVVIACHGIGADRTSLLPFAETMNRRGYAVILFDFRAHGRSGARHGTAGYREVEDVLAVIGWARANSSTYGLPVVLYGQSLGAACALMAAARCPYVRAVVAESPFSRLDRAIDNHFSRTAGWAAPVLSIPTVWWGERLIGCRARDVSPEAEIARIAPRTVLLIQDAADRQAPPSETAILVRASGGAAKLWTVPGADHVCAELVQREEFERRVVGLFDAAAGKVGAKARPGGERDAGRHRGGHASKE